MDLTKNKSSFVKGIAVILMIFHHLFAFPDRLPDSVVINYVFGGDVEYSVALFGKICVPMFMFISGYGYYRTGYKKTIYYLMKVRDLLIGYWLVFFIFIPIGILFFRDSFNSSFFERETFLLNLLALSSDYNREWWFLEPYMLMVLLTPILNLMRDRPLFIFCTIIFLFVASYMVRFLYWDTKIISISSLLFWLPVFLMGYLFGFLKRTKFKLDFFMIASAFFLFMFAFYFFGFKFFLLIMFTPIFIMFMSVLFDYLHNGVRLIFIELGDRSLFIWLTHTFICYYFFSDFTYALNNSIFIFLLVLISSYLISLILNKLYQRVLIYISN